MPRGKRLTDEQRQRVIELRTQGLTHAQIAKRTSINKTSVQRLAAGVEVRPTPPKPKPKPGRKPKPKPATNGHAAPVAARVAWSPAAAEPTPELVAARASLRSPAERGVEVLRRDLADMRAERDDLRRLLARMLKAVN